MNQIVPPPKTGRQSPTLSDGNALLERRWLVLIRLVWATLVVFVLIVFAASLPTYVALMQTVCSPTGCVTGQLTTNSVRTLAGMGLSLSEYAIFKLIIALISALVWFTVALVIAWRKSSDWMALLVALFLVAQGSHATTNVLELSSSAWQVPSQLVQSLAFLLLILIFSLFPDGRFRPSWTRWLVVGFALFEVSNFFPISQATGSLLIMLIELGQILLYVGFYLSLISVQFMRYRRFSSQVQRQQIKWVIYSVAIVLVGEIAQLPLELLFPNSAVSQLLSGNVTYLLPILIPLSIGIAILRYHLWDIDILINRTLVYGALTASIIGLYVLVVVALGSVFQAQGNLVISLVATGLIAVLFQPLRERLQRFVNRLMYGDRDTPYQVISRLGQRLEATIAPETVLPTIVETVAQALKLPYTAMTLKQGDTFVIAASYGVSNGELTHLALLYQTEQIGELLLAPRGPSDAFTPADQVLLADLARQAGTAAHAVRLTTDLKHLTNDLQLSRERLIAAREEERRRLRRDLHDGLGPTLGHLTLQLDGVSDLIVQDPSAAQAQVAQLKALVQATMADIRQLVYALRPPALDELGLVTALCEQATQYQQVGGLQVTVEAPTALPPLPAAVEVAAYRIALEALTNVVRHAQAHTCCIILTLSDALLLDILDDGRGFPPTLRAGVGLASMRERAAELGGTCVIEARPEGGTRVYACLPLPKE